MFIADLHIHSAYSRATSKEGLPPRLEWAARRKGIDLLATGDFTHPAYRNILHEQLEQGENGLLTLKKEFRIKDAGLAADEMQPHFIISGEISSIYKHKGKGRKVHNVVLLPDLEAADRLSKKLEDLGCNIRSDGRPIIGLSSRDLMELTLEACKEAIVIPAHIWTPYFSVFGAYSGYETIEDCYEDMTPYIYAVETGLSSDPPMNWRLSELDKYTLVSNSDAHSPDKLAREANLFNCGMDYRSIYQALADRNSSGFYGTIEFYPEEGKYHWDGHRDCKHYCTPKETLENNGLCPVCGKPLTIGVLHQVEVMADREEGYRPDNARPFENLVPLAEVMAGSLGMTPVSRKIQAGYEKLLSELGSELHILRECPIEDVQKLAGPCVAEGLKRLRDGQVKLRPGYDGEYGKVTLLEQEDMDRISGQTSLFAGFSGNILMPKKKAVKAVKQEKAEAAAKPASSLPYGLSEAQWKAASSSDRTAAVMAGPGCGKTHTLVSRIAYLLEQGVPANEITAVTFTNKAAREMKERLQKQVGTKTAKALNIGTFHSLGLQMAREKGIRVNLMDDYQAAAIAEEVIAEEKSDLTAKQLLKQVSVLKNSGEQPDGICLRYAEKQQEYNAWDFDDILCWAKQEAEQGEAQSRFRYLMIDEFQDINALQYQLVQAWSKNSESLFVIGDPDQAIYGFRGSDPYCFQRLKQDRPDMAVYYLNEDYRSTPEIVNMATAVLKPAVEGLSAVGSSGEPVQIMHCGSGKQEAIAIAKEINEMIGGVEMHAAHGDAKRSLNDIAVLYRTHKQGELIGECLDIEGIPYRVAGREDFLAAPAVRETIGFFRLLERPEDRLLLHGVLRDMELEKAEQAYLLQGMEKAASGAKLTRLLERMEDPSAQAQLLLNLWTDLGKGYQKEMPSALLQRWIDMRYLAESEGMDDLLALAQMYKRMPDLIHDILFGTEGDLIRSGGKQYSPDGVTLLTLHGSKGLEFPTVFLAGVRDGLIPLKSGSHQDPEEEKRLFYVGITRAEKQLLLMTGDDMSPFLREIPQELYSVTEKKKRNVGKQMSLFDL